MINWPESLTIELAARRCIIFIGAGCSAGAARPDRLGYTPPTWAKFLGILHQRSNRGDIQDRNKALELLDREQYLESAEILRASCLYPADYSHILIDTFEKYRPTDIHRAIESIDQKIVVTTNYDTLYENHCMQGDGAYGYAPLNYYDQGLVARLRSPKRLIIKVHGSIAVPERTVLSRSDYFKSRAEYPGFFMTLGSLFLTHTLLFLGYSVSDPDIQLLLENAAITAPSDHPHYASMAAGLHPALKAAFRRTFNIEILEFDPADNYEQFLTSLNELAARVEEARKLHP